MSQTKPSTAELDALRARIEELQKSQIQARQVEEGLHSIVQGISSARGDDFFRALVRHLARVVGASHVFVGELVGEAKDRIRTLAFWAKDGLVENFEYRLEGTPSEQVVGQTTRYYPHGVRQLFPNDPDLAQSDVESYLAIPLFDTSGGALGLMAIMHDTASPDLAIPESILTVFATRAGAALEHRRTEQTLLAEEECFRAIADYTYDWENWVGTDGKLLWVNPAVERLTGYSVEECLAMPDFPLPLTHEDDRAEVERAFAAAINETSRSNFSHRIRCKDGSILWIAVNWQPIFNRQGVWLGHRSSIRDITEQKRVEEALRASERNYRTTLDSMGDAIHVVDADMRILLFNTTFKTWCQDLGLETDVIGRTVTEIFPFLPDKVMGEYEQVFRDQKILVTEEHVKVGSRALITETRKIPVIEGQKVVRVITVIRDITEQKRAEGEKARLEAQLYQAQKLEAIGQLAGGVAHDFNNLLVVIMGNASMVQKDRSLPVKIRDSLADIASAAERGSELTRQLLAYARGGIQQPMATDLNRLIGSIVPMLQRTAPAKIRFALKLGEDLPPILADPPRIEQVVVNLCLNAIQATKPPGTITFRTSEEILDARQTTDLQLKEGRYLRLQVKDSGCGIRPEIRERIFEPFFSTKEMGRGLGLSVTHGIIQSHRGQIRVDRTSNRGTSFSIWLPVTDRAEAAVEPPAPRPKLGLVPRGSETILVIDDEIAITQTVEQILSSLGYCVITHTDADQAIAFLDTNAEDVNLVLCDLMMPKLSGGELASRVARQYPHIAVLLTSGLGEAEPADNLKTTPAIGAIQKPFTLMGLAKAVRNALDQHASARPPAT